ncbi:MAG: hypothetical protein PHP42_03200 [Bacteroidota bacterium]|nr:hypothetical protein [Bacteroidota bacterium]
MQLHETMEALPRTLQVKAGFFSLNKTNDDGVMQNDSTGIAGAEYLTEVIGFLKNADKHIRLGDVPKALEEIVRAREKNPTIMYARAYEEYVRSIIAKQRQNLNAQNGTVVLPESIVTELLPALEKILDLAIKEVKRSAVSAYKQKEILMFRKRREEETRKDEETRKAGISRKIISYISRARELVDKKDFHNALSEVARAFMLDPTDEQIHELEDEIKTRQQQHQQLEEEETIKRQKEELQRRQELFDAWHVQRKKELDLKKKQEEEVYKQARAQKIREYLQVTRTLLAEKKFNEAMSKLAFVLVLDPLNEEILRLNWQIQEALAEDTKEEITKQELQRKEGTKKKEAIREGIRKHLVRAEQYLSEKKFSDALRIITQAYFIDPTNEEVAESERKILAAEEENILRQEAERKHLDDERRRQQEAELHRSTIEQQKRQQLKEKIDVEAKMLREQEDVLLCLSKARGFVSLSKYEEALILVAQAFKINPFDEEITKLQHEIVELKRKKLTSKIGQPPATDFTAQEDDERSAAVKQSIQLAQRLRQQQLYKKALDEIAQAYQHNPLNEELFALEGEIQQEYLKYEEQQRAEQELTERNTAVKKSLAKARECISREEYGEASAWIDYALSFDMQRFETLQLKEEVAKAQRQHDDRKANEDKELVIQFHLSRAMEFITEKKLSEATLEVDLALRLNPVHENTLSLQNRLKEMVNKFEYQHA